MLALRIARMWGLPVQEGSPAPWRSRSHALQENSDVESPVLASYWIPNALIRDRFASAIVRLEPTG